MNKNCKLSIITICYNAEKSISKTIESVLAQNEKDLEYIIIDGASSGRTVSIINRYHDNRIRLYSKPDRGISDAFNRGMARANGQYLYFLNSGDYLMSPDCLESVSKKLLYFGNASDFAGSIRG